MGTAKAFYRGLRCYRVTLKWLDIFHFKARIDSFDNQYSLTVGVVSTINEAIRRSLDGLVRRTITIVERVERRLVEKLKTVSRSIRRTLARLSREDHFPRFAKTDEWAEKKFGPIRDRARITTHMNALQYLRTSYINDALRAGGPHVLALNLYRDVELISDMYAVLAKRNIALKFPVLSGDNRPKYYSKLYPKLYRVKYRNEILSARRSGVYPASINREMYTVDRLEKLVDEGGLNPDLKIAIKDILNHSNPAQRIEEMISNAQKHDMFCKKFGIDRNVKPVEFAHALERHIKELDLMTCKDLPGSIEVLRDIPDFESLIATDGELLGKRNPLEFLTGTRQHDVAYMTACLGTSPPEVVQKGYRLILALPRDGMGVYMGVRGLYPDQHDVILPRGMNYAITSVIADPSRDLHSGVKFLAKATIDPSSYDSAHIVEARKYWEAR